LYRGNDKSKETILPSYEEMDIELRELKNRYPDFKIILQSDEIEFCDFMKKYENSIIFEEVEKINKTNDFAIQHKVTNDKKILNSQIFLAIMSIISKTKFVILNSGNVGMWVCLFRGSNKNVHQYLNPKKPHKNYWFINDDYV